MSCVTVRGGLFSRQLVSVARLEGHGSNWLPVCSNNVPGKGQRNNVEQTTVYVCWCAHICTHAHTHTQIKGEIRVTSVSFIRQSFHWASGLHLLLITETPCRSRQFSMMPTNEGLTQTLKTIYKVYGCFCIISEFSLIWCCVGMQGRAPQAHYRQKDLLITQILTCTCFYRSKDLFW